MTDPLPRRHRASPTLRVRTPLCRQWPYPDSSVSNQRSGSPSLRQPGEAEKDSFWFGVLCAGGMRLRAFHRHRKDTVGPEAGLAPQRRLLLSVVLMAVLFAGCSATRQRVTPEGDVIVRTGNTLLGSILLLAITVFVSLMLFVIIAVSIAAGWDFLTDADRPPLLRRILTTILVLPFAVGFIGLFAAMFAAATVFRYHSVTVTASEAERQLTVQRERLAGGDSLHSWAYEEIVAIDYLYVPGDNEGAKPQGHVSLLSSSGVESSIFEGPACPARKLTEAVAATTKVPVRVKSLALGGQDISSPGSFLNNLRCGTARPFHPTDWGRYPSEAIRVLDLPFLWRWVWAGPIIFGQTALLVSMVVLVKRWRASRLYTAALLAGCAVAFMAVIAMNVFATRSYGTWPAALALLALISIKWAHKRLDP